MLDLSNRFGLTVDLKDFSQKQYEVYEISVVKAISENTFRLHVDGTTATAHAAVRGASVRGAITAGFLTGVTVEQVGDLKPAAVTWLANQVAAHVKDVTSPPPDPN